MAQSGDVTASALHFDVEAFLQRPRLTYRAADAVSSYLYVMRCERFVKVGISNDVQKRLAGLQGANPFPVSLANKYQFTDRQYAWVAEQTCHAVMRAHQAFGEWFDVDYFAAIAIVRQVVPATRRLMQIHARLEREAEAAVRRRYEEDPKFRAKREAEVLANRAWLAKHNAREAALRDADQEFEQRYVAPPLDIQERW